MPKKVFDVNAKGWIKPPMCSPVSYCNSRKCLCCKTLDVSCIFQSYATGCTFAFSNSCGTNLNCKSSFVIYLISCTRCSRQYVGQTRQSLHKRLNGHRSSIVNNKLSTYLCQHFNSDGHSFDNVRIQIVDCVNTSSLSLEEAVAELNAKEDFYMKVLNTFFPIGLNDRIQGGGCVSRDTQQPALFYSSPIPRRKRGHGARYPRTNRKYKDKHNRDSEILDLLTLLTKLFEKERFSDFYKTLRTINKDYLKGVYRLLSSHSDNLACVFTSFFFWRFGNKNGSSPRNERATLVVNFSCRKIDLLNIPSIVSRKEVTRLIPDSLTNSMPFRIFYKLRPPIALQFCNYSKFLKELNTDAIKTICEKDCICSEYKDFVYDHHGHVFTGNVELVQNSELRKIMQFGAKFRMDKDVSWDNVIGALEDDFEVSIRKLARKYKVTVESFRPWYNKAMEKIDTKMKFLRIKGNHRSSCTSNRPSPSLSTAIAQLHEHFIVSTVDKASNNFAFICKKFYILVLLKELGFNDSFQPIGNVTYSPQQDNKEEIIERHCKELSNIFKIDTTENNKILPKLFWIPKLHKNPYKFRFIAGARSCTTKSLSVMVNLGLKVVKDNFRNYCNAIFKNSGYDYFWSINSTQEFIRKINKVTVHSLQVYDFSTLYTNIDQSKILEHLLCVLNLVFNDSRRKYLCIRYDKAFFASKTYSSYTCFNLELFARALTFVISEVYVVFGGLVFKQTKGIPMGGNCSPLLADLFLSHCEYVYMSTLVKNKKFGLARLLSHTSRYIDDLCIVNYKHFHNLISVIYPEDLIAERNGSDDKYVDYLDVKIEVDTVIRTSVFHKVDDFNFPVILLTFPESLIPSYLGYCVFAGQVLRYLRICSHLGDFLEKTKRTMRLLIDRGYDPARLKYQMEKMLSKNSALLCKFDMFSARQIALLL